MTEIQKTNADSLNQVVIHDLLVMMKKQSDIIQSANETMNELMMELRDRAGSRWGD